MKTYNFCNNCGKQGHGFHQCKIPITSLGVITLTRDSGSYKMLLICRKDSLGFVDFVRGRYGVENRQYVLDMINIMTVSEKERLLASSFADLWTGLWGGFVGMQYRGEEMVAKRKFEQISAGIDSNGDHYTLEDLVRESSTSWETPEWGFPKGRRNFQEKDQECAIREWEEETGHRRRDLDLVLNVLPYEENFTGSNFKSYKHKYFLGYMDADRANARTSFQETEVSQLRWVTADEAKSLIRPYNLERIKIVTLVDSILKRYRLYR